MKKEQEAAGWVGGMGWDGGRSKHGGSERDRLEEGREDVRVRVSVRRTGWVWAEKRGFRFGWLVGWLAG